MPEDPDVAIALQYNKQNDNAPRVIAKGMRLRSDKIRAIAKEYNIPIMRNVTLADALYRVEVGQEVPEELYDAVAEVLNLVYALHQETENAKK